MNFFETVYKLSRDIPYGKVATYGQLARLAGNPKMARQVGWALHQNPDPATENPTNGIPCHRVVNRFGQLSGSFAFGGENEQRDLLISEGVAVSDDNRVDLSVYGWER